MKKKILATILAAAMILSVFGAFAYSDVNDTAWYAAAVKTASDKKWFSGYPDGTFLPEGKITRAEAAKVLGVYKYGITEPAGTETFTDVTINSDNKWYMQYAAAGVVPYTGTEFKPDVYMTRQDTMYAIVKIVGLDLSAADESVLANYTDITDLTDEYKKAVAVAVKNGIVKGYNDTTIYPYGSVTRAEFATFMMRADKLIAASATATPAASSASPSASVTPAASSSSSPAASTAATAAPKATATPAGSPTPTPMTTAFADKTISYVGDGFVYYGKNWTDLTTAYLGPKENVVDGMIPRRLTTNIYINSKYIMAVDSGLAEAKVSGDYCIISLGGMEWYSSYGIDDADISSDTSFCGAFNIFLDKFKSKYPNTKLVILTMPYKKAVSANFDALGITNKQGLSSVDYSAYMVEVCNKKRVSVIDLSDCWSKSDITKYLKKEKDGSYYYPNDDGSEIIAKKIAAEMIKIAG